jgi:serine/threonine protein kinase
MQNYKLLKEIKTGIQLVERYDGLTCVIKDINLANVSPVQAARVLQEVHSMKELQHPCMVTLLDDFMDEKKQVLHVVTEYCPGSQLGSHMAEAQTKQKPFSPKQVMRWTLQLLLALNHLHSHQISHGDVRLSRVFVTSPQQVKLSMSFSKGLDGGGKSSGVSSYIAPELIDNKPADTKTDVWALGVVLYALISLRQPFPQTTPSELYRAITTTGPEPLSFAWRGVEAPGSAGSERLAALVMTLTTRTAPKPNN